MKTLLLSASVALLTSTAMAEDLQTLSERYVALPAVQQMLTEMFGPEAMAANFLTGMPPGVVVTEEQQARIGELLSDVFVDLRPQMEQQMVDASAANFTETELEALIDFYGSDLGASILLKTQPFMAEFNREIQPVLMGRLQAVLPEVMRIMQE